MGVIKDEAARNRSLFALKLTTKAVAGLLPGYGFSYHFYAISQRFSTLADNVETVIFLLFYS